MFGMFLLLYFILWIAIPLARTPRQKLEMRGEKITASSIRQRFEEVAAEAMPASPKNKRSASVWADVMYTFGRILQIFLKAIIVIIAFAFAMAAIGILVSIVWVFVTGELYMSELTLGTLSGMEGISITVLVVLALLVALIPLVSITYLLISLLFGSRTNGPFLGIMGALWLLIVVYLTVMIARNADYFRDSTYGMIDGFEERQEQLEERLEDRMDRWERDYDDD
jgi:hypothetical protein